jgi:EAL domain-containing protein (putative c-di-GMP-specific phosphodiesterase class I)
MQWLAKLTDALENDYFILYFQPIVSLLNDENKVIHYEVLIRYKSPKGKIQPPGAFLPAAERYGKILEIDRWVIAHAIEWLECESENTVISINLSGRSVTDETLVGFIKKKINKSRVNAKQIFFEITETAAIDSLDSALYLMAELKKLGCRFALDDFGSGLSSFSYLKHLPVDVLKIDGSFVRTIATDPVDLAMVKSINDIGHEMGIATVAEFVESAEILEKLKQLGVDYVQGYAISPPVARPNDIEVIG